MTGAGPGVQLDKSELKKLMEQKGIKTNGLGAREEKVELKKSEIVSRIFLLLITCAYFIILIFGRFFIAEDNEIYKSLNVFYKGKDINNVVRLVSYAVMTVSVGFWIRLFIDKIEKKVTGTRRISVAFMELLSNMVKYVTIFILVFLFLNGIGVDTKKLLAGLGILSLIIGLGVTSLVEDVVAGIFIIAEHLFDVGDIVVVNDFRGTVVSIGIRSTQIEDEGGDILALRNSSVESLVNMTNRLSYAICEIPVDAELSIEEVEKIIEPGLEEMSERISDIEQGPFYLGLSEMHSEGMVLTFVAICQENAKYWVQRQMNRELKILFDKNEIALGEFIEEEG